MPDNFLNKIEFCKNSVKDQQWPVVRGEAEKLMQLYPDKPHGFVWLFSAQWHLGEENTALETANKAILQFPNIEWVWRARAGLAEFANDHALAHEYWQDCIENFPNMVDAYAKGVAINLSMGNTKKRRSSLTLV